MITFKTDEQRANFQMKIVRLTSITLSLKKKKKYSHGILPKYYTKLLNTHAQSDIEKGEPIRFEHTVLNQK